MARPGSAAAVRRAARFAGARSAGERHSPHLILVVCPPTRRQRLRDVFELARCRLRLDRLSVQPPWSDEAKLLALALYNVFFTALIGEQI